MDTKKNEIYTLAKQIAEYALEKKALEVSLFNISKLSSFADYFIICHGEANLHVKAIADGIVAGTSKDGFKLWNSEGYEYQHWILLDYVDIVVHVFIEEYRRFYSLERLWGDAEIENFN